MGFREAYSEAYRARPLRTVFLTVICLALGTFVIVFWLALASSRRSTAELEARSEAARELSAQLAITREWPEIILTELDGATARLSTTCQGYGSLTLGTLRYRLTIDHADAIDRRVNAAYFPNATFAILFLDRGGFKQRQIVLRWPELIRTVSDSSKSVTLQANDAAGWCGPEIRDYAAWNLTYALPAPRQTY